MCIKSSCTNCHTKSHCQEFSKNKQISKLERTIEHLNRRIEDTKSEDNEVMDELLKEIEEYKKLTEKLIKELEDSNKCLELAGEKIEKMKNCDNCKNKPLDSDFQDSYNSGYFDPYCSKCIKYSNWELG